MLKNGIDFESSHVASMDYDEKLERLLVTYKNGTTYSYHCTPEQWTDCCTAESKGKAIRVLGKGTRVEVQ